MNSNFKDFEVGDLIVFDKTFSKKDWNMFVKISGDENPLHSTSNSQKTQNLEHQSFRSIYC